MSEDTYKYLLSEFYGLNKEPLTAKKHLSSSKGIESFENVTDLECMSSENIISSEEIGKKQSTLEESEKINDDKDEDVLLKSPHVLTVEEISAENIKTDKQILSSEPDIIEDQKEDKNIPTKNFTRLEDTFTKAIAKVSETPVMKDTVTSENNSSLTFNPVSKAKKLWRQKTMLSKENLLTPQNIFSKCDGVHLDLNNAGISDFPVDMLQLLNNIQLLYLDSNNLMEIPEELFVQLQKLKWLDVRNNQLVTIPSNIKEHKSLETLLLQGNNIEKLPLELGLVPNLKNLQTAHNPLVFPPQEILDLDSIRIINFLREEWNKSHPDDPVELKKLNNDKIEKKPSTILCYQNFSKRPKTSRCQSAGGNLTFQRQKLWMSIAKNIISDQTSKLQKLIDRSVLEEWRYSDKFLKGDKDFNKFSISPPYALHTDDSRKELRNDSENPREGSDCKRKFSEDLNEFLRSLRELDDMQKTGSATPSTKQKQIQTEMEKIIELQKKLQRLKLYNDLS